MTANQIVGNMFSHIDYEGNQFHILIEITDHNSDGNLISISDGFINSINGNNLPKKTTAGRKIQLDWEDGSTSWFPLKDLKASNPIELS